MTLDPSATTREDVSICICTYRRPRLLDALLAGLHAQREGNLGLHVVVVDNDPDASARGVLDAWQRQLRFPLDVLHVATPNIALARNAGVAAARGDWVAFIDDDERPEPGWIAALVAAAHSHQADIAFGPVLPELPTTAPRWMVDGGFYQRTRHATGTLATLDDARTGNALVRRSLLAGMPGPFDPAFGNTGGSDTMLFRRLHAAGARMVWSDEAIVHETIPAERATARWLLQRAFRNGQVGVRARLRDVPARRRALVAATRALGSLGLMSGWLVAAIASAPFSRIIAMRMARKAAGQAGIVLACLGHRYREYGP